MDTLQDDLKEYKQRITPPDLKNSYFMPYWH